MLFRVRVTIKLLILFNYALYKKRGRKMCKTNLVRWNGNLRHASPTWRCKSFGGIGWVWSLATTVILTRECLSNLSFYWESIVQSNLYRKDGWIYWKDDRSFQANYFYAKWIRKLDFLIKCYINWYDIFLFAYSYSLDTLSLNFKFFNKLLVFKWSEEAYRIKNFPPKVKSLYNAWSKLISLAPSFVKKEKY